MTYAYQACVKTGDGRVDNQCFGEGECGEWEEKTVKTAKNDTIMVRKLQNLLIFLLLVMGVEGNNIRSGSTVEIVEVVGDTAVLQFDLQWDNSWRDDYNWDAAWVFLKYKESGGGWQPVYLGAGGHAFTGDYTYMTGKSSANVTGLYVYRSRNSAGATSTTCRLKWKLPAGMTQEKFKKNQAFIMAQGVEMVLVPYGAYYLGDGVSERSFVDASGDVILMDGEEAKGVKVKGEVSAINLATVYPKGYKGFYVMKYELSQEQYIAFLNTLTFVQQAERIPGLATMKQSEYIFGNRIKPNNRNGIIVNVPSTGTVPVIFANNLNNDGKYNQTDDGKTIACNYMTSEDMYTYCSWVGLRPMSELEYEKASRTPYPETPKAGEYAWNDNATPVKASAVNNGGMGSERPTSGNVNAGNAFGPIRSGSFAKVGSSQVQAGATYWGVMEMSGNLKELCITATGALDGSVSGSGAYSKAVTGWTVTPAHYGLRGGGFTSADERLRTSDRSAMTVSAVRDSTVGFRGVGVLSSSALNGGTLTVPATNCAGTPLTITGTSVSSAAPVNYQWYVKAPAGAYEMITGATDVNLIYDQLTNETSAAVSYSFKRKAFSAIGEGWSDEKSVAVTNASIKFTPATTMIDICGNTTPVSASPVMSGFTPTYRWLYNGSTISGVSGATYTPSLDHFGDKAGNLKVNCTVMINGCSGSGELTVSVPVITKVSSTGVTMANCGSVVFYDDRDGDRKTYCTVKIGTQCWMAKNLNVGKFTQIITGGGSTGDGTWTFNKAGIQKWCNGGGTDNPISNVSQCDLTGGLYEWWETICGGKCNGTGSVTPGNAMDLPIANDNEAGLIAYGAKMVPGSLTLIQGICPDGWHIPTDAEWTTLGSNQAGWNAELGGVRGSKGQGFFHLGGRGWWWSSTPTHGAYACNLYSEAVDTVLSLLTGWRSIGGSMRCLRN